MHHTVLRQCFAALIIVTLSVLGCVFLSQWFLPLGGILLVLQLSTVCVSLLFNQYHGIAAALVSALCFNYFFTQPRYSFHMSNVEDAINFFTFVVVALISSELVNFYRKQQKALRQAQLQTDILRSVSHDLRTPLSTIIGSMETLQQYALPEQQKQALVQGALEEGQRLHHYIENLLLATKIQHGELLTVKENTDVFDMLVALKKRFDNNRISLKNHTQQLTIEANSQLMQQAIYNVIDNALKYTKDNVDIVISSPAKHALIAIFDYGEGIANNDMEAPFTLFSTSRLGDVGTGGVGLGLNVARAIVTAHGGKISLNNTSSGLCATIELPLSKKEKL
ncbi:sensor histidine kinase [Alteromonas sp. A081]|uniref:sensor histidine kinase n=1 Tax=Alteromonas sp. A081 TaxID=3410269 RepID=UPI003B987521